MLDSRFFFLRQHPHRSCISVASSCTITQKHFALSCIPQLKITLTWIVPRLTLLHLHWYQSDKRLFLLAEMFCSHDHGLCLSLSNSHKRSMRRSLCETAEADQSMYWT
jgi:hypothetical protein